MKGLSRAKRKFILSTLIIPVTLMCAFTIYPIMSLVNMSFTDFDGIGNAMNYIGFDNYVEMITDTPNLWLSLKNNLYYLGISLLLMPIELALAAMFVTRFRGVKFFKAITFMPYIINGVAMAYAFSYFLSPINGGLNTVLEMLGLGSLIQSWLSDPQVVIYVLPFVLTWKWSGYHIILFAAALQSVPKEIMEAASVDGANAVQVFMKIQMPSIRMIREFILFTIIAGSMQQFELPFVMTGGGPGYASSTFTLYTINIAFTFRNFGLASAMAITMIFMIMGIYAVKYFISKLWQRW